MAIQFYMRGYNTVAHTGAPIGYVDWVVNDVPDSSATFVTTVNANYVPGEIANVIVNRIVQSKVDNFLKPTEGFVPGGADSYWLHVNAYDWLNQSPLTGPPNPVISTPPQITGLAIVRGTGNGVTPRDFSTLFWDEVNQTWKFAFNTNGDGTTVGALQNVALGAMTMNGPLTIGTPASHTGLIRITNNQADGTGNTGAIKSRNTNDTGDITLILADNGNRVQVGSASDPVHVPSTIRVDTAVIHGFDSTSTSVAQSGFIRDQNNVTVVAARNAALSLDIPLLSTDSTNHIVHGSSTVNAGQIFNISTGSVHDFQVNGVSQVQISLSNITFPLGVSLPTISQATNTANTITGQTLTLQAQNATGTSTTGGALSLTSGTGTTVAGNINLQTGAVTRVIVSPTAVTQETPTYAFGGSADLVNVVAPTFKQNNNTTASSTGQVLTVQAQNSTGTTSTGGALNLTSGSGTTTAGRVNVQTGGTTQIIVSPTIIAPGGQVATTGSVIILGNLEVVGTTTTVDSTVVDIIGRVIHANWADPAVSPNVAVPSQLVGYSVHRGNAAGVPRDGAAWIWTEGAQNSGSDGYWRSVTTPGDGYGTDGYTVANVLNIVGTMSSNFSASPDPNAVAGTLPAVGGLRAINNASAVAARNVTPTATVAATSNLVNLNAIPSNTLNVSSTTGFTTAGSLLIFSDAGVQTLTYTGTGATTFTGVTNLGVSAVIHTGVFIAQTNKSTTIAAGSNNVALPTGTINVASNVGFPTSGTIRVVTTGGVQTVSYTNISGTTQFTGCTGGTGTMLTGLSVSSLPIIGNNDLLLLGTDFGNRIIHGAPTINTGHIFNTSATTTYDFQVNSISQVVIGAVDTNADGYVESISIGPTVNSPRISQTTQPDTGANAGFPLVLQSQAGQQQTGGNANNNGGKLVLASGAAGTGGAGAAGVHGTVDLQTDAVLKVRVFPTAAAAAADNNSILVFENKFRFDVAQGVPLIRQDDQTTNATNGQSLTLQAQNSTGTTTVGGPLLLQSGTGTSNDGYINLITGATTKMTIFPTTAVSAADNNSILFAENLFRVATAQTTPRIRQDDKTTNAGTGETFTIQAQNETGTTSTGGSLNLASGSGTTANGVINLLIGGTQAIAFNSVDTDASGFSEVIAIASTIPVPRIFQVATGGASGQILALMAQNAATTGGPLQLHSGTGATNDGYINLTTGSTVKMTIFPTTATVAANNNSIQLFENKLRFDTAQTTPLIRQDDKTTNAGTGELFTVQAQNETGTTSTGGTLALTSGTGTTVAGNVNLQTGGTTRVSINPTFTTFNDTTEAYRITPVSAGATTLQAITTATSVTYNQGDKTTNAGTGATTTLQAQNETGTTSTGGALVLTSGTGTTTAGNTNIQTGGVTRVAVNPTFTTFNDAAEAFRITPVSAGTTTLQFATGVTAATLFQADKTTNAGTGATLTVQAQNETGTTSTGGALTLTSGTGTTTAGNVNIQTGAVTRVAVNPTFTTFNDTTEAYRITPVSAGATTLQAINTATSVTYKQGDLTTASGTGATTTIQAQNETGTTSTGGALTLTSGTGTTTNGALNLQVGGTTTASLVTNKFVFNKGRRRNVQTVTTTITVPDGYDYIAVDASSVYTISLPATPTTGDTYEFKDFNGTSGTNTVTVSGNGKNIDGLSTALLNSNYTTLVVTYTGTQWSIS